MSLYEAHSHQPEWESAIGRLMLASAHLEMSVLQAIANYGGDELARTSFKKPHSARLTVLESLAGDRDEKTQVAIHGIVEMLRQFNKERNHVAHNPLMYALDGNSTDEHAYGSIVSIRDTYYRIGLSEVVELAERARGLSSHFMLAWMSAMGVPE